MDRKGQIGVGSFVLMFVVVITAIALLNGGISSNVASVTNTVTLTNQTYTSGAVGSSVNIPYQALKGTIVITNASSGTLVPSTNYTVTNYVVSNGQLVTTITSLGGAGGWQGKSINVSSSTVEPFGYDTSAGGRAVTSLIVIFAALALAVGVLSYIMKDKVFDMIGR